MSDKLASDSPLSTLQQTILAAVLDLMIPADPVRNKPSATDVGVLAYIEERDPNYIRELSEQLTILDDFANNQMSKSFVDLDATQRMEIVESCRNQHPRIFWGLVAHTAACYYQDSRVQSSIGLPSRPPYPEGYTVPRGDLSLLEPVRKRGPIWRKA